MSRRFDIIVSILNVDKAGLEGALAEDAESVNAIHGPSGKNAAMLAAVGRLPDFLEAILWHGSRLDFAHRDNEGDDLMEVALSTAHGSTVQMVSTAYETFAPHIINNWPEPD